MKILTYLGFTLLSILIQFSVMDFLEEKMNQYKEVKDPETSHKVLIEFKNLTDKPYALYYQRNYVEPVKLLKASPNYSNSTITESFTETTSVLPSSVIDVFYDENTTATEYTSTESMTTTEVDNMTEITLFEKTNTTTKPKVTPKKNATNYDNNCYCNLLFKVCDINCCCDADCSEADKKLFDCAKQNANVQFNQELCFLHQPFKLEHTNTVDFIENLFCVAKTNLPEKRNIHREKGDIIVLNKVYKWKPSVISEQQVEFSKKTYNINDPIWLYKNGSINYIDLPVKSVSSYCYVPGRPLLFLQDEKIQCNVKFGDLEMFRAYKLAMESIVISVTENTMNSTKLNCSTLACTNWTVIVCHGDVCSNFNKTLHEPYCSQTLCSNIAHRIDYTFYYHDGKFVNATMKFYTETVLSTIQYIAQEINVKFVLGNSSVDDIIAISGNPGYIRGLPIIVSYEKQNRTINFFNSTKISRHMSIAGNKEGSCVSSNITKDFVLFGVNKRRKCRHDYKETTFKKNATDICKNIQNSIDKMLNLKREIAVAPLGNPYGVQDKEWIIITKYPMLYQVTIYGQYEANSKLKCYNLVTQISYIFVYKDFSEIESGKKNKIIAVFIQETAQNMTLPIDDLSVLLTIDINFIDNTTPPASEFASSPHLNIHLPKDFFFPFPSNNSSHLIEANIILCLFIAFIK